MRTFLAILAASATLGLQACGTTSSTRFDIQRVEATTFRLTDARPLTDRVSSKSIEGNSEQSILGDDAITPPPPELLRAWLHNEASRQLAGKAIELRRFKIEISDPGYTIDEGRFMATASSVPGANPLSALLARYVVGGIESARAEKLVTIYAVLACDGEEVEAENAASFQGRVTEANVNLVIRAALENITIKLTKP